MTLENVLFCLNVRWRVLFSLFRSIIHSSSQAFFQLALVWCHSLRGSSLLLAASLSMIILPNLHLTCLHSTKSCASPLKPCWNGAFCMIFYSYIFFVHCTFPKWIISYFYRAYCTLLMSHQFITIVLGHWKHSKVCSGQEVFLDDPCDFKIRLR